MFRPRQFDRNGTFGGGGGGFGASGSPIVLGKSAVAVSLVEPAVTFTSVTPTDGGSGTIVLTSAGVHGLTAAVSVGANIYISGGTGWTPGLYPITAIDLDTTGVAITIAGTFDVGMGAPTIALANTLVQLVAVPVPALLPDSQVRWDVTFSVSPDASAGSEDCIISYGGSSVQSKALSDSTKTLRFHGGFANRGVTDKQTNFFVNGSSGSIGNNTLLPDQYTIDSSIPQYVTLAVIPSAANRVIAVDRYLVELLR